MLLGMMMMMIVIIMKYSLYKEECTHGYELSGGECGRDRVCRVERNEGGGMGQV